MHHPIFAWLVEHAADVYNKNQKGDDGLTPYERLKGKPYPGETHEFGIMVRHRIPGKTQGGDMSKRFLEGVYLGSRFESTEHIVAMAEGSVVKARTLVEFPAETQWLI